MSARTDGKIGSSARQVLAVKTCRVRRRNSAVAVPLTTPDITPSINIPWPFDFLVGDQYSETPLRYTLVPTVASLRWQMNNIGGPWILRGNWDYTFTGAFTWIPRGPETHYLAYDMGIRRNFVRPNWRVAPFFDFRVGVGRIDAKEPLGVTWAQGQDLTFTFMLGSGMRYNFNSKYAISAGINFMHVSNLYLSEPKYLN